MTRPTDVQRRERRTQAGPFRRRRQSPRSYGRSADFAATRGYETDTSPVWEAGPVSGSSVEPVARRDMGLRRALALSDVLATSLALTIVTWTVAGDFDVRLRPSTILIVPLVLIAAKAIGLYDRDQHMVRKTTIDEVPSLLYLAVLFTLSVWLAEAPLLDGYLTRPQVFALLLLTFALLAIGRLIARFAVASTSAGERCIIVGNVEDAQRVARKLESSQGVNVAVCARVALHSAEAADPTWPAAGTLSRSEDLARFIGALSIERVIIAPDGHDQDEILHVIRLIKALGVRVSVLPRLLEVVGSSSTFEDVDGLTLLGVRHYGVSQSSAMLKRLMDLLGAGAAVILLAPLLLILAVAVKLDSRGPVFFRQRRIGRRGEVFSMLKFRSMVRNAEEIKKVLRDQNEAEGGLFKIADDPRITRVGGFLRKTSLDELPQLFNVLGGTMSLVGPRPLVADEDALIEGWQRRRLAVKPGMTGMWQIFGSSRIPMPEMVKIDYLYGANWSLWLDLKILLRTIPYVLRRRGQ
jgi:exopolysaccharide biosynthesis polyprenyl glycosylphosphotransferase